jgi:hypothetical protein
MRKTGNLDLEYMKGRSSLEEYRLIVEKSACSGDPESYAGGSVSSW